MRAEDEPDGSGGLEAAANAHHFPCLDGVRGMAVLMVLLDHANDSGLKMLGVDMNRAGKYGVYLFFVLSAFLLTHQIYGKKEEALKSAETWFRYAYRRFLRIFPMYALVLVLFSPASVISHLLMREGEGPFWAIPVEVKYYLLLPFVVLAMIWAMRRRWRDFAWSVFGLLAAGALVFVGERAWSVDDTVWLFNSLAPFLAGSVIAVTYGILERDAILRRRLAGWLEGAAVIALVVSFLRIPWFYNLAFRTVEPVFKFSHDATVCGALWAVFLLGTLGGTGWMARAMAWMPLRFMGWISFSLYLWHKKVIDEFRDLPLASPVRLLLCLLIVIGASSLSYFLLERPISKLAIRIPRKTGAA